jgi:hypothetical protein
MSLSAPENEQRLYKKNVLKQNYFPPVYCTLRPCGKFLILNALLAGIRMNCEARIMLIVTSSVFFIVVWWYTTYAHVLQLLSLLFAGI